MTTRLVVTPRIYEVVTLKEAAWMWCRDPKGILLHIYSDHVIGRKSKGTWLVDYQSLVNYWGDPLRPFLD